MLDLFFIAKKTLSPFLLPPGLFITILLISGVWFLSKKHWKAAIVNFLIGLCIWIFSIPPVSDIMLRKLESEFYMPENPVGDVIILLGGGVYEGVRDYSGIGVPSEYMLARIVTAVRLHGKLKIPIIVSGGSVFRHKNAESPIVRRFLIDLGVSPDKVILEDKSRDTIENAKYSLEICKENGFQKPILITSAYHMKRAVMSFEKVGMKVMPFPAGFKTWQDKKYGWDDYLPDSLNDSKIAVREYIGIMSYKIAY